MSVQVNQADPVSFVCFAGEMPVSTDVLAGSALDR